MQALMIIGVYIWGALYTAGVFVAALSLGNHIALYLSLVSAGAAYVAQFAGAIACDPQNPSREFGYVNSAFTAVSAAVGVIAGLCLIIGV
jgi:hypothetical protein